MAESRAALLKKIEGIFRDVFEQDGLLLSETVSKENLEAWDSLGHIRLVSAMEEEMGVTFTLDEIESMSSVGRVLAILESK